MRSEGRAEGLRAFAERERMQRATSEPAKGARRAAVRATEVAKQQPTRELEREAGNVARWKAAKAARVARGAKAKDADTAAEAGAVEGRRRQRVAFAAETMPVPTGVKVSNKHCRTAATMLASREAVMEGIRETRAGAMERTLCENTVGGIDSAWRLWLIFCPIRGVDPGTFGQYSALIPLLQRQVLCVDTTASTPSTLR